MQGATSETSSEAHAEKPNGRKPTHSQASEIARPAVGVSGGRFLRSERDTLERYLPGLDEKLATHSLSELEKSGSPAIPLFKQSGGPKLVIPAKHGGLGASAVEVVQVQRAIGSRSPSLSIASTMHTFSAATLVEYALFGEAYGAVLLQSLATDCMLLASGFSEARPGARPLAMTMLATATPDKTWIISGRKKPCSLSRSMDFLTAGVTAIDLHGNSHRAVALVPADLPGIDRRPFWGSPVLAGAESDELILNNVVVPNDFVFIAQDDAVLDPAELLGYVWLQTCLTASYIGMASGLVERLLAKGKVDSSDQMTVVSELESCALATELVAHGLDQRRDPEQLLARIVQVRFATMTALERVSMRSAEMLGGIEFVSSPDVSYLLAACRGLAFHPPSRRFGSAALAAYYAGGPLDLS